MGTRAARALTLRLPAARPSRHRAAAAMSAPVVGFAIRVARKLKAIHVIDVLSDLFILRGIPARIRSDNGPEFVAKAVQEWIAAVGAKAAYRAGAAPGRTATSKASTPRLRDELLNSEIFYTLREA
jgi:putative transposase